MRRPCALLLAALIAGCQGPQTHDHVLILDCVGDEIIDAQPVVRDMRRVCRVDPQGAEISYAQSHAGSFARSGKGELRITSGNVTYERIQREMDRRMLVKRSVVFGRSSGIIQDLAEGSWGAATLFQGRCRERQGS